MLSNTLDTTPFRCPHCHGELDDVRCRECGREVSFEEGIPVLLRDPDRVRDAIAAARRSPRAAMYEEPQATQFVGPYRHHVRKRRAYVDSVLRAYTAERGGDRLAGLDLGCGDGEHLPWLATHVSDVYGSDYSILRLRRAKAAGHEVVMADATDYPAADNSFDVIWFNHVIEHIPDDVRALREVHRILRPGGLVILGTPNEGSGFARLAYRLEPESRVTTDHVHFYTADALAEKCRAAGFTVRQMKPIGWGLPHWSLDTRVRTYKAVDDLFERIGRRWLPSQATSLYALLTK